MTPRQSQEINFTPMSKKDSISLVNSRLLKSSIGSDWSGSGNNLNQEDDMSVLFSQDKSSPKDLDPYCVSEYSGGSPNCDFIKLEDLTDNSACMKRDLSVKSLNRPSLPVGQKPEIPWIPNLAS